MSSLVITIVSFVLIPRGTMADAAEIKSIIGAIADPVLHRPIGDIGILTRVEVGRRGAVTLEIAIPVPGLVDYEDLKKTVVTVAEQIDGVKKVDLVTNDMRDEDRQAMMEAVLPGGKAVVGGTGSPTRVIGIASGKGGVGKSSVATNLAVALAGLGRSVGVIDADVWGYSIPRMLGAGPAPVVIHESIVPPSAYGVKAMSMDYFVGDDRAVIWRGPMLHKAIEQFLTDVFWDDPDFLLVDMPPGTGDIAISLSQFLPRAQLLLVTTPQPTAQRVARRSALMAAEVNQEVIAVIENMSYFLGDDGKRYDIFGSGGGEALAADLGVPLIGQIPLLPAMREGADNAQPVSVAAPDSDAAKAFVSAAEALIRIKPRVRTHPELVIR